MEERIIGSYTSNKKGPLLFVTAGVHGNEPSGIKALEKVFEELTQTRPEIHGQIVGVRGNMAALQKEERYIDQDLNRTWTEENVQQKTPETQEIKEMHEIISVLERFPEKTFTKRYFLDCHTTSSESLPYISVQDVHDNDAWAQNFPTYIVRGFSDIIYGAIDHYLSRTGLTGFVFEAGQHQSTSSQENHEGLIWLALEKACRLNLKEIASYPKCVERFTKDNSPSQKIFEIIYRYEIKEGESFQMEPGYDNFQEIKEGDLLARSNGQEVRSQWNANIFMPLYQSQGNDGFFVINEA